MARTTHRCLVELFNSNGLDGGDVRHGRRVGQSEPSRHEKLLRLLSLGWGVTSHGHSHGHSHGQSNHTVMVTRKKTNGPVRGEGLALSFTWLFQRASRRVWTVTKSVLPTDGYKWNKGPPNVYAMKCKNTVAHNKTTYRCLLLFGGLR